MNAPNMNAHIGNPMNNRDQLIEDFLNNLFTTGYANEVVDRLVLTTSSGKDVGGWGRVAIKRLLLAFAQNLEEGRTANKE